MTPTSVSFREIFSPYNLYDVEEGVSFSPSNDATQESFKFIISKKS